MIVPTSVPDGQDSAEQSWMPLPKSMLVHKQAMSVCEHPKLEALLNMFVIQVFYSSSARARDIARTNRSHHVRHMEEGCSEHSDLGQGPGRRKARRS